MLSCYLFFFVFEFVYSSDGDLYQSIYIYTYIFLIKLYFILIICVIWPVEVTICTQSVCFTICQFGECFFFVSLLFSLFYLFFLCAYVRFRLVNFLVCFVFLSLFKVHDYNRNNNKKIINKILKISLIYFHVTKYSIEVK